MKKFLLFLIAAILILTGCSKKEAVFVNAARLSAENIPEDTGLPRREIISLSEECDLFLNSKSAENSCYVVFSSKGDVKDFTLYTIAVGKNSTDYDCEKPVLYYDELSAQKSLIVRLNKAEGYPWTGISYTDEKGNTVRYAVHTGNDEVYLEKFA